MQSGRLRPDCAIPGPFGPPGWLGHYQWADGDGASVSTQPPAKHGPHFFCFPQSSMFQVWVISAYKRSGGVTSFTMTDSDMNHNLKKKRIIQLCQTHRFVAVTWTAGMAHRDSDQAQLRKVTTHWLSQSTQAANFNLRKAVTAFWCQCQWNFFGSTSIWKVQVGSIGMC